MERCSVGYIIGINLPCYVTNVNDNIKTAIFKTKEIGVLELENAIISQNLFQFYSNSCIIVKLYLKNQYKKTKSVFAYARKSDSALLEAIKKRKDRSSYHE